jgi:hypothetical protein
LPCHPRSLLEAPLFAGSLVAALLLATLAVLELEAAGVAASLGDFDLGSTPDFSA